ncbi:uncharacterized protein LOC107477552 [Arachis duranensis]|uniref:Uncharacterized protein LOC107477552 n=1 Tax=Arachis duranensis TaxID=130453 RepID=A0A6P4CPD2_ARADU|nr:uncharacterized protein LOC107477552 [Arachis duranensis]
MHSSNAEDRPSSYAVSGEMELKIGLKFLNWETAMLAVKNYNIRRSVEYKVVESDQSRCLASSMSQDHAQLDSNVIYQYIFPMMHADATICVNVLQGLVESAYGYKVSYKKVWHVKQKAIARIYGDWDDLYDQLRRYFNALQAFVLGMIVDLQTQPYYVGNTLDRDSVMFHQVFWSFPSCVQAFRHCKLLVSVDGIHLYGKYADTLLMGIAQDGNNNILPVAFALAERENTDSWYFFLTNLRRHVATRPGVLLISDRHAAIKAAFEREGCG